MKKIKSDVIKPFDVAPEDITWRMRYSWLEDMQAGGSPVIESVLPYLETEAAKRLASELVELNCDAPKMSDGYEEWIQYWKNEALHNCDSHSPIGRAGSHLSEVAQAATNLLMTSSELRDAIHYKHSEKSAALGMLLICEALTGGYSIALTSLQNSRKKSYEKGIGGQVKDFTKARNASVHLANRLWEENPDLRIGNVANAILVRMQNNRSEFPTLEAFPKVETIKAWLKEASAAGKLAMPEGAQKRGRLPKLAI